MSLNFITNFISKISVSEFIAIVTFIGAIVYSISDYLYKITCEKRYSIEKNNFTFNNKFLLFMLSAVLLLLTSMILQLLSEYILDDKNKCMVIFISSILLFEMMLSIFTLYDIYIMKSKNNGISISNLVYAIVVILIYNFLFLVFTKANFNLKGINDIGNLTLNEFSNIISCIFKYILIFYFILFCCFIINKIEPIFIKSKKDCCIMKCLKKLKLLASNILNFIKNCKCIICTFNFILKLSFCIFFSISFFYLAILYSTSNAAMKVNDDISKKLNIENKLSTINETGEEENDISENILINRAKEIRHFPLNTMKSYFNNPEKLYSDEFIGDYMEAYSINKVPNEFVFDNKNDNCDKADHYIIEYFRKKGILKDATRIVRVSYFLNIFDENEGSIIIAAIGYLLYIFSIATILWILLDDYMRRVYEIIDGKYVVLSKTDDRYLVMDCEVIFDDLKIYAESYKFISINNKNNIRTKKFKQVNIIHEDKKENQKIEIKNIEIEDIKIHGLEIKNIEFNKKDSKK